MIDSAVAPAYPLIMPNAALAKGMALAARIQAFFEARGVPSRLFAYEYENPGAKPPIAEHDLLIALGGDGTLLRAGHLAAPLGIPVLGVQAGRLGFLVELNEDDLEPKLALLLQNQFRLEQRMMLRAERYQGDELLDAWDVINEIVVARGHAIRPLEVRVDLQEGYLTSYIADGLIVATATGSTAYALAAGGPILPPELRNMLVLPIAPHLSLDRAVVLAEGASVVLRAYSDHETLLSIDGMSPVRLSNEQHVLIHANSASLDMVRFGEPNYFYRDLSELMQKNPAARTETP